MNTLKKLRTRFAKRPVLYSSIIGIIVIILAIIGFSNGGEETETLIVQRGDFVNEISVSGKVVASQSAELGFDQSGRIASINKKVGDTILAGSVIASIENGTVRADVRQKQAALEREQAKLTSLQKGTRQEELIISAQAYSDASSALIIAMRDSYLKTEDALQTKVDTLFNDGSSVNPTLTFITDSVSETQVIERQRAAITVNLQKWITALDTLNASSTNTSVQNVHQIQSAAIASAKILTSTLSALLNDIATRSSPSLSQEEVGEFRSVINSASQDISSAASEEQSAYAAWTTALNEFRLDRSGSTQEDIAAQAAQVKAAEADLASAQAQLRKTLVIAPFSGTVTRLDLKVGEIVSPNESQISVMSSGTFEVESFIPEVNIARVQVGNPAVITLDAYGDDVSFPATIISIEPAETIRDGVSTYKTRLQFAENDPRIKSGMTANIRITTERKSDVISIPQSIISSRDGKKYVRVKTGNQVRDVEVTTGSSSGLGQVEVLTGLTEGDVVILPPITP